MHQKDWSLFNFVLCDRIFIWMHNTNITICSCVCVCVWQREFYSSGDQSTLACCCVFIHWLLSIVFFTCKHKTELIKMSVLFQGETAVSFTDKRGKVLLVGKSFCCLLGNQFDLSLWSAICPLVKCLLQVAWMLMYQRWIHFSRKHFFLPGQKLGSAIEQNNGADWRIVCLIKMI